METLKFEDRTFQSPEAAIQYLKSYLNHHESIPDSDYPLISAFMKHHPKGLKETEKVIIIPNCEKYPKIRCFAVVGEDGVVEKRGAKAIISGYDHKEDVYHCLRWLIKPQIDEWKEAHSMPEKCPLCNKPIENPHIDHIVPFRYILYDFLNLVNKKMDDVEIIHERGADKHLKDEELGKKFIRYHKQRAKLRYLCAHCNITRR